MYDFVSSMMMMVMMMIIVNYITKLLMSLRLLTGLKTQIYNWRKSEKHNYIPEDKNYNHLTQNLRLSASTTLS
jgi:hypothetical protein